ncbi:hypothetical protein DPMN_057041 [Dreissena polymorpha]|uniref:non-specific protein-tyrosine kinase n=1 Tax=Dreissena polymorpha TaxID=45954 RepID=A0A9D4HU22_DREPO|nr:hypothetical protein DPMN_057041 [Dreissena polymorpha]
MVDVLNQEDDWWEGAVNGKVGIFPSNYVEIVNECDLINVTDDGDGRFSEFEAPSPEILIETNPHSENVPNDEADLDDQGAHSEQDANCDSQGNFYLVEVDEQSVKLQKMLSRGRFTDVFAGKLKVAVKTLKPGQMTAEAFLEAAKLMFRLRHPKLVQVFAVRTACEPMWIITELMVNGNLRDYLRTDNGKTITFDIIVDMAGQIADGMAYFETNNCIHRDLQAMRVMVGTNNEIKIADFELARRIIQDNIYKGDISETNIIRGHCIITLFF